MIKKKKKKVSRVEYAYHTCRCSEEGSQVRLIDFPITHDAVRGGLVFRAHRLLYHSRVIKKKKNKVSRVEYAYHECPCLGFGISGFA